MDTINEAAPLLEFEQVHADAFLGVGALVHTYCRDHPDCHDHQPVRRVMDALHSFVTSGCRRDTSEKKIEASDLIYFLLFVFILLGNLYLDKFSNCKTKFSRLLLHVKLRLQMSSRLRLLRNCKAEEK